jgi:hypothetical protein
MSKFGKAQKEMEYRKLLLTARFDLLIIIVDHGNQQSTPVYQI